MLARLFPLACLLAGCGSSSGAAAAGVTVTNNGCALPSSGVFRVHYVPEAGNTCGPISDAMVDGSNVQSPAASCPTGSGEITDTPVSGGGCKVTGSENDCQVASGSSSPESANIVIAVTWSADYTSATGTASFTISGSTSCSGIYDLTITKQ